MVVIGFSSSLWSALYNMVPLKRKDCISGRLGSWFNLLHTCTCWIHSKRTYYDATVRKEPKSLKINVYTHISHDADHVWMKEAFFQERNCIHLLTATQNGKGGRQRRKSIHQLTLTVLTKNQKGKQKLLGKGPEGNLCWHGENMQTPYRKAPLMKKITYPSIYPSIMKLANVLFSAVPQTQTKRHHKGEWPCLQPLLFSRWLSRSTSR